MILLGLALVFLITRVLLFFSLEEELIVEGLYIGTIAKDILEGMMMPIWDYQFSSYDGGVLVSAVFLIPFFLIFGQVSLSFAMASIFNNILILAVWYKFLERNFSKSVAGLFGLLYVICPFLYFRWGIVLGGNHAQVVFFYGVWLMMFYEIFFNPKFKSRTSMYWLYILLLGIISGFGMWFCYSMLVLYVPVLIFWYFYSRKISIKTLALYFFGYLVGYSPFFFRANIFGEMVVEEIFSELVVPDVLSRMWWKFKGLFAINSSGETAMYLNLFWVVWFVCTLILIWIKRKTYSRSLSKMFRFRKVDLERPDKMLIIVLFPVIFLVVYLISNFNILYGDTYTQHYRYLMPISVFIFAVIALSIDKLISYDSAVRRKIGMGLLIFCLFLGIRDCILNISIKNFPNTEYAQKSGFSYEMLGTVFAWRHEKFPHEALDLLDKVRPEYRPKAYRGFGYESALLGDQDSLYNWISEPDLKHQYQLGYIIGEGSKFMEGSQLGESYPSLIQDMDPAKQLEYFLRITRLINRFDSKFRSRCFRGLGIQFNVVADEVEDVPNELKSAIGEQYWPDFVKGVNTYRSFQKI